MAAPVLKELSLVRCRHRGERPRLYLAIFVIAIIALGGLLLREKDVMYAAGAIYLSMLFTALQAKLHYRLHGAEVTPTQFPAVYRIAEELRKRFDAPDIRIFVLRKQLFRAEAFGLSSPYVVVLPSVLIDALELEELKYVLGQAFGQICFGHTKVALLLGGQESDLPAVLSWAAWLRDLIFAGYWRAATASADRAGIVACGDAATAIRTQLKLSVGTNQLQEINPADLLRQASKVSEGFTRFQAMLIRWRSPTQPLIPRLKDMAAWAGVLPAFGLDDQPNP